MSTSLKECIFDLSRTLYELDAISKEKFERAEASYLSSNLPSNRIGVGNLEPEEIKELRRRNFLSEADLAACLRTTIPTIKNWENGKSQPNDSQLVLLNILKKKGLKAICE